MVRKQQIDALILGCTELPLILTAKDYVHFKNNQNPRRIDYKVLSRKLITPSIIRKFISPFAYYRTCSENWLLAIRTEY